LMEELDSKLISVVDNKKVALEDYLDFVKNN